MKKIMHRATDPSPRDAIPADGPPAESDEICIVSESSRRDRSSSPAQSSPMYDFTPAVTTDATLVLRSSISSSDPTTGGNALTLPFVTRTR